MGIGIFLCLSFLLLRQHTSHFEHTSEASPEKRLKSSKLSLQGPKAKNNTHHMLVCVYNFQFTSFLLYTHFLFDTQQFVFSRLAVLRLKVIISERREYEGEKRAREN